MQNKHRLLKNYGYFIGQPINDYHNARSNGSEMPLVNNFLTFSRHHDVDSSNEIAIRDAAYQCDEFVSKLQLDHSGLSFKKISLNETGKVVYEFELSIPEKDAVIGINYCDGFCTDYAVGIHNMTMADLTQTDFSLLTKKLCKSMDKRRDSINFKLYV